jgi:hypothetical protein
MSIEPIDTYATSLARPSARQPIDDDDDQDHDDDDDEALARAARGEGATEEDRPAGSGEIDAIGAAAGVVAPEGRPLQILAAVDDRDSHRWELDPDSAEDEHHVPGPETNRSIARAKK